MPEPDEIADPNATDSGEGDELLEPTADPNAAGEGEEEPRETRQPERAEPGESIGRERGDALPPEASDRIARLERSFAEQNDLLFRLSRDREGGERREIPDRSPVDRIESMDDLARFLDWREQRLAATLRGTIVTDAGAAASEQRARGLFSREAMGEGRDYDALTNRHLEPIERADPSIRRVLASQRDPAAARYALSAALELLDRFGGDPVKGFAALWKAVDGGSKTSSRIFDQVRRGAERQVGRTNLKGARSGAERRRGHNADEIKDMSVDDFVKSFPHLVQ